MHRLFVILLFIEISLAQNEWTYKAQDSWERNFPKCGGTHQSPININTFDVVVNPSLEIDLFGYDSPFERTIFNNNGHTVRVTLNEQTERPFIFGSAVGRDRYIFEEFHFHWGTNGFDGSEHSINHNKYAAELHFVHYNKKYGSLSNARNRHHGLAVLTVFLSLSQNDNKDLKTIINTLPKIIAYNSTTVNYESFVLSNLFPRHGNSFYRYDGSLTTPPCSETARFLLFAHPIKISQYQLKHFRHLLQHPMRGNSKHIIRNTRNIHPKNGRIVEISKIR